MLDHWMGVQSHLDTKKGDIESIFFILLVNVYLTFNLDHS